MDLISVAYFMKLIILIQGDSLSQEEEGLAADFIQIKNIHHCLFVQDPQLTQVNISFYKFFSLLPITVLSTSLEEIYNYLKTNKDHHDIAGTIVIYKTKNLIDFSQMTVDLYKFKKLNFLVKFTWLIFTTREHFMSLPPLFIPYSCEFFLANEYAPSKFEVFKYNSIVQKVIPDSVYSTIILFYCSWNRIDGLDLLVTYRFNEVVDMNQSQLIGCFVRCPDVFSNRLKEFIPVYCYKPELIRSIYKSMNFRYSEIRCRGGDSFDFFVEPTPFYFDFELSRTLFKMNSYVKYLPMEKLIWFIKYPVEETASDLYVRPFHSRVWISIIAVIIVGGLLSVIIQYFIGRHYTNESVFVVLDYFSGQGSEDNKSIASCLFFLAFSFLVFYVFSSYSADLTAYLSVKLLKIPFTDLQTFVDNGEYKLVMINGTSELNYFLRRNNSVQKVVRRNFLETCPTPEKLIEVVCEKKVAVSVYSDFPLVGLTRCRLLKIKNPIQHDFFGIILGDYKSPSPFAGIINHKLLKMIEGGILQLSDQMLVQFRVHSSEKESGRPIEFDQIHQILSILAIGTFISLIMIFTEFLVYKFLNTKKKVKITAWR